MVDFCFTNFFFFLEFTAMLSFFKPMISDHHCIWLKCEVDDFYVRLLLLPTSITTMLLLLGNQENREEGGGQMSQEGGRARLASVPSRTTEDAVDQLQENEKLIAGDLLDVGYHRSSPVHHDGSIRIFIKNWIIIYHEVTFVEFISSQSLTKQISKLNPILMDE